MDSAASDTLPARPRPQAEGGPQAEEELQPEEELQAWQLDTTRAPTATKIVVAGGG